MASPIINSSIIRFGLFEVDLQARELRKSGVRIKIQEQPFQILAALLERPGEIVTREDLQKRLWPADTFVDFDLSLNSAVKKLRVALNDDSENPRFVETLYRRGYRFIGPVNPFVTGNERPVTDTVPAPLQILPSVAHSEAGKARNGMRFKWLLISTGVLILIAAGVALWFLRPQPIRVLGYTQIT